MMLPNWIKSFFVVSLLVSLSFHAAAADRIALLIANKNYDTSPLKNPINDAKLLEQELKAHDFDVTVVTDGNERSMLQAIEDFGRASKGAEAAVFYYSGHGMQDKYRQNYLLPVEAKIGSDADIRAYGVEAYEVIDALNNAKPKISLVIFDACRDNPFAGVRGNRNFAVTGYQSDSEMLISYATQAGQYAQDGSGNNSPFAIALAEQLRKADELPLLLMFDNVSEKVKTLTNNEQNPTRSGDAKVSTYLVPKSTAGINRINITMSDSIENLQCDKVDYETLRYNQSYSLPLKFNNNSGVPQYIHKVDVFPPANDFDKNNPFPDFKFPDAFIKKDKIVKSGSLDTILVSNNKYSISAVPSKRKQNNAAIRYRIFTSKWIDGKWTEAKPFLQCNHYEISWCGDGVLDTDYQEQCDPNDSEKKGWGNKGCSATCHAINDHDTCDTTHYEKLRHGYKYDLGLTFVNSNSVPIKFQNYSVKSSGMQNLTIKKFPDFLWTPLVKDLDYEVSSGKSVYAIKSSNDIELNKHPAQRISKNTALVSDDKNFNASLLYKIKYFKMSNKEFDLSTPFYQTHCQYYEVTWCGDGIVDNYVEEDGTKIIEQCDPADPNKSRLKQGQYCHPKTCTIENS